MDISLDMTLEQRGAKNSALSSPCLLAAMSMLPNPKPVPARKSLIRNKF